MELCRDGAYITVRPFLRPSKAELLKCGVVCRDIHKHEGVSALFKGLGPTLAGAIPARSINFFVYGNGKQIIASNFNGGVENSYVHLSAAAVAGTTPANSVLNLV